MYSSYITGVIGDEGIMNEMNNVIAKHDYMVAKKRWALHQCWQKDVFENINDQVEKKLKTLTKDQIKDRIRKLLVNNILRSDVMRLKIYV